MWNSRRLMYLSMVLICCRKEVTAQQFTGAPNIWFKAAHIGVHTTWHDETEDIFQSQLVNPSHAVPPVQSHTFPSLIIFPALFLKSLQLLTSPLWTSSLIYSASSGSFPCVRPFLFLHQKISPLSTRQAWSSLLQQTLPPSTHLVKIVEHSLVRKKTHRHTKSQLKLRGRAETA